MMPRLDKLSDINNSKSITFQKPILKQDFETAIGQYFEKSKHSNFGNNSQTIDFKMDSLMNSLTKQYKSRFVVNIGLRIQSIEVANIACFNSIEGDTYLIDIQG